MKNDSVTTTRALLLQPKVLGLSSITTHHIHQHLEASIQPSGDHDDGLFSTQNASFTFFARIPLGALCLEAENNSGILGNAEPEEVRQ